MITRLVKGLAALVMLTALVVGVPALLVLTVGNPWPGRTALELRDTELITMGAFAALGWLVWARFIAALLVEAAEQGQQRATATSRSRPSQSAAGTFPMSTEELVAPPASNTSTGRLAHKLIVAALLLLPIGGRAVSAAAATPEVASASTPAATVLHGEATPVPVNAPTELADDEVMVAEGDTLIGLSARHLDDPNRWREIFEMNKGKTQPDGQQLTSPSRLRPGWILQLPQPVNQPAAEQPGTGASGDRQPNEISVEVESGDTLYGLIDQHGPDPVSVEEVHRVAADNDGTTTPDGTFRFDASNPDLIHPGQVFVLDDDQPAGGASDPAGNQLPAPDPTTRKNPAPSQQQPTTPQRQQQQGDGDEIETSRPQRPEQPAANDVDKPAEPAQNDAGGVVHNGDSATSAAEGQESEDSAGSSSSNDERDGGGFSLSPVLLGLGSSTALASGVFALYRGLRRRQQMLGGRGWQVRRVGAQAQVESTLVAASNLSLMRWAAQELAMLIARLDPRSLSTAAPVALEVSEVHGLELLWDESNPSPAPAPWEAVDSGWAWRLLYDPDAPMPASELPAAVPGLVTLGSREDGRDAEVLVDLEAFGSIAVTGDGAEDWVRSAVLELGAGEELADAYVLTLGVGVDGAEQLPRVAACEASTLPDRLEATVRECERTLEGASSTFALRAGPDAVSREVQVAIVRQDAVDDIDRLVAVGRARRGVALIVLGETPRAAARFEVDGSGRGWFDPLNVAVRAAAVSRAQAADMSILLDQAADLSVDDADDDAMVPDSPAQLMSITVEEAAAVVEVTGDGVEGLDEAVSDHLDETADSNADAELEALLSSSGDGELDLVAAGRLLGGEVDSEWSIPEPEVMVRLLGPPVVEGHEDLGCYPRRIVSFLACRDQRRATLSQVMNAVWGGKHRTPKTFDNYLGRLRAALGPELVPNRRKGADSVQLGAGVGTDIDVLQACVERAAVAAELEAVRVLRHGLSLVRGEPFDALGMEWAIEWQDVDRAGQLVERAALQLAVLVAAAGDLSEARWALQAGMTGTVRGNEALYRARMQLEAQAGNHAAVQATYTELQRVLAPTDTEPSRRTQELVAQLTGNRAD